MAMSFEDAQRNFAGLKETDGTGFDIYSYIYLYVYLAIKSQESYSRKTAHDFFVLNLSPPFNQGKKVSEITQTFKFCKIQRTFERVVVAHSLSNEM